MHQTTGRPARYSAIWVLLLIGVMQGELLPQSVEASPKRPQDEMAFSKLASPVFHKNQFRQVVEMANAALARDANLYTAYYFRGLSRIEMQEPEAALKDLETYEKFSHDNQAQLMESRARCYTELGQWQKAITCLDKALAIEPKAYRYRLKSQILRQLKDDKGAAELLKKALALDPNDYWSACELAICYTSQKLYKEALVETNRMIKLRPDEPNGYVMRAKLYQKLGRQKEAEQDLKRANQNADFPF